MRHTWSFLSVLVLSGVLGITPVGLAQTTFTFTTIDPPGSITTFASGISGGAPVVKLPSGGENQQDQHEGTSQSGETGNWTGQHENDDSQRAPTAGGALQIVGYYYDGFSQPHSYMLGTTYSALAPIPGAYCPAAGVCWSFAVGLNSGRVVGYYYDNTTMHKIHGFMLVGTSATTIDISGAVGTFATGVNSGGEVVGYYYDAAGMYHGFLWVAGKTPVTLDAPGAYWTFATGINTSGQISGYYDEYNPATFTFHEHGFLRAATGGITAIDVPGALYTVASGINTAGQMVGSWSDPAGRWHGFTMAAGRITTFDVGAPLVGVRGTLGNGINDTGQIVGEYWDSAGKQHGFSH